MTTEDMYVTKRDGRKEEVSFDKILNRIKKLGSEVGIHLNYTVLAMKVIDQLYNGMNTTKIDELAGQQCASLVSSHPDYGILAGRIVVSNHHKNTKSGFYETMKKMYENVDVTGNHSPLLSENTWKNITFYRDELDAMIDDNRDYLIDYFGFKTLEKSYLMKVAGIVVERPQHMWLRVAVGIHGIDIDKIRETYDFMSQKYFTHATPTLFNSGTPHPQLSSCYLLSMESDSISGIFNTLSDCAEISKWAGGIGLHIHNIRASGTRIQGTNGVSNGIVPMLRVFNSTARYVDQGGGKRNGSFAIYLEPWHADIEAFLELRKNHGDEELKARDLFYALWIPDLFMNRVNENGVWTLMCPHECPGLSDVYGEEFETLYCKYEKEGRGRITIEARKLWLQILDAQMETGTPYLLYKDTANRKSNQKNLGTIKSSNLCTEIIEYSSPDETAVCNLASICLPSFVDPLKKTFDFKKLEEVTQTITYNLNRIIDINYYPTEKTRKSNLLHRPIGIGVQGLSDAFILMDYAFESKEAAELNKQIFETIYFAALDKSSRIAQSRCDRLKEIKTKQIDVSHLSGDIIVDTWENETCVAAEWTNLSGDLLGAYSSFNGSPASMGILQYDLWGVDPGQERYDWVELKERIVKYGLRNSLLVAPMPTASTSQIMGFNECFEPITSNIYSRRTLAGEFVVVNKYLMKDLLDLGLWTEEVKNNIIANQGSIQQITNIPESIKRKYKIVWEMSMKTLIDMSRDRGAFICQSQSLNCWLADPTYKQLTSMHFYSWKAGLKTGLYYLRRKAKHAAQQFTIVPTKKNGSSDSTEEEGCVMCSA